MGRALLLSGGSRGDVEPLFAIGAAHGECLVLVQDDYVKSAAPKGCTIKPLSFDLSSFFASYARAMESAPTDERPFETVWRGLGLWMAEAILAGTVAALAAAVDYSPTVVLTSTLTLPLALVISDVLEVPLVYLTLQPDLPTRYTPHLNLNAKGAARAYATRPMLAADDANLVDYARLNDLFIPCWLPTLNEVRAKHKLAAVSDADVREMLDGKSIQTLIGVSPRLAPRPPDLPDNVRIVGALAASYMPHGYDPQQSHPELCTFLDEGPAPIVISFGSMHLQDAQSTTATILRALRNVGAERMVFLPGNAGICPGALEEGNELRKWAEFHSLTVRANVQYGWLLPRSAALMCHGGSGAVHAALKAGAVPIVVPVSVDQPFFAALVENLNIGSAVSDGPGSDVAAFERALTKARGADVVERCKEFAKEESDDGAERVADLLRHLSDKAKNGR